MVHLGVGTKLLYNFLHLNLELLLYILIAYYV